MNQSQCQCYHCGEPTTRQEGERWALEIDGQLQLMCCPGCKAVAETIVNSGLKDYYRHRTELPELSPADVEQDELTARDTLLLYDSEAMQRRFIAHQANGSVEATLVIDGISCAACAWLIEHRLQALDAVNSATLNLSNHRLIVNWDLGALPASSLLELIHRLGYRASPFSATSEEATRAVESKRAIRRLAVAGIGMMQVMMLAVPLYAGMAPQYEVFMRFASMVLSFPVVMYAARPFFEAAIRDLRTRHLTMDVPVSLAIFLAFTASIWSTFHQGKEVYFDSVCMFTFLLLLGRFLEMRARHKMGKSGNNLLTLLPNVAIKVQTPDSLDQQQIIAAEDIQVSDLLLIKPGASIPADGVVVSGQSTADEAALTGEYLPINKKVGDQLIGGTVNIESPLVMKVTATGAEAQLSTIVRLMDRAQLEKPKVALIADKVASYFVAAVLLVTTSTYAFWFWQGNDHAFFIALSLLVVTCPCALSLATPTALTAATAALREQGLLISRGHVLEVLPTVDRVVFDKTGTLTHGKLSIEAVLPIADVSEDQLLALAAGLEQGSSHPIARAFRKIQSASVSDIEQVTGFGIRGVQEGDTGEKNELRLGRADFACTEPPQPPSSHSSSQWLLLSRNDAALGWIALGDSLRKSSPQLVAALHQQGIKTALLTGDPSRSGQQMADSLNIHFVASGMTPEQKLTQVKQWQAAGETVLMMGDGINDVPVLAAANIAVAVSEATDLAKTNADALLTGGQLTVLETAITTAHRTRRIIKQNIGWALGYNLIALPIAAMGFVPPWAAAIGMSFSSLLVVGNALRLGRVKSATNAQRSIQPSTEAA